MPKQCPSGKILNPKTNQCVKIDGAIGKSILAAAKGKEVKTKTKAKADNTSPNMSFDHVIFVIETKDYVYVVHISRENIPLAIVSSILNMQKGVILHEEMEKKIKSWLNKIGKKTLPKNSTLMMKYSKHQESSFYKTAFSNVKIGGRTMTLFLNQFE